jgi:hypothetical protein
MELLVISFTVCIPNSKKQFIEFYLPANGQFIRFYAVGNGVDDTQEKNVGDKVRDKRRGQGYMVTPPRHTRSGHN